MGYENQPERMRARLVQTQIPYSLLHWFEEIDKLTFRFVESSASLYVHPDWTYFKASFIEKIEAIREEMDGVRNSDETWELRRPRIIGLLMTQSLRLEGFLGAFETHL